MPEPIFIFTWNPDQFKWKKLPEKGGVYPWRTCATKQNHKDAYFILVRTGKKEPGIVGYGTLSTNPYKGTLYTGSSGWLVDLKFDNLINKPDDRPLVPRHELLSLFPTTNTNSWAPQSNGAKVAEENRDKLFELLFSDKCYSKSASETDREILTSTTYRLVQQRIGQDRLRNELLAQLGRCEISGLSNPSLLRASHIRPWSVDPGNRGNLNNALLLAAPYDFLFDQGLISFDKNGCILISPQLSSQDRQVFSLRSSLKLSPERNHAVTDFMTWHRNNLFQNQ